MIKQGVPLDITKNTSENMLHKKFVLAGLINMYNKCVINGINKSSVHYLVWCIISSYSIEDYKKLSYVEKRVFRVQINSLLVQIIDQLKLICKSFGIICMFGICAKCVV